ncbi:MAG: hypothetical protein AB8H79_19135, partial [Myxococcota bacterium]
MSPAHTDPHPLAISLALVALFLAPACDRAGLRPIESDTTDNTDSTDLTDDTDPIPTCETFERMAQGIETVECRVPFGSYTFTETWRYPVLNQYRPPLLAHLDDDNGDGKVGEGDVPEILFQRQVYRELPNHGVFVVDSVTGEEKDFWPGTHPTAYVDMGFGPGLFGWGVEWGLFLPNARDPSVTFTVPDLPNGDGRCRPFSPTDFAEVDGDGFVDMLRPHGWHSPSQDAGWATHGDGFSELICLSASLAIDDGSSKHIVSSRRIYNAQGRLHCEAEGVTDGLAYPADYDGDGRPEVMLISTDGIALFDENCTVIERTTEVRQPLVALDRHAKV